MALYDTFKYGDGTKYGSTAPITISYSYSDDISPSYRRLKNYLVDEHIYDKTRQGEPFIATGYIINGTVTTGTKVTIYVNGAPQTVVTTGSGTNFSVVAKLGVGENLVQAMYTDSLTGQPVWSNILSINTYNIYLWLLAYGVEFDNLWGLWNQVVDDLYLAKASNEGLKNNFENFTYVTRPDGFTLLQYRDLLRTALNAHYESTTWWAIEQFTLKFCSQYPILTEYRFQSRMLFATASGRFFVDRVTYGTPTLMVNWTGQQIFWAPTGTWQIILDGSVAIADNDITYFYIDGTVGVDGYLVVKQQATTAPSGVILATAQAVAGNVTSISCGSRFGAGGIYHTPGGKANTFKIDLNGSLLTSEEKDTIQTMYHNIKPAHKKIYLKFSDEAYARVC